MSSTATSQTAPTPLRDPRLRRIIVAYTVNRLGTWFGFIALTLAVFDHTNSAVAVAALLVTGQAIPAFLTPALVARLEASSRRGLLSGLYLFEAVATASLAALLLWHFSLPGVLLLIALDETAALAASALLRAEAARCAREWVHAPHEQPSLVSESLPAHTYAGQVGIVLTAGEHMLEGNEPSASIPDGSGADAREGRAVEAERRANAALNVGFAGTFVLGPVLAGLVVAAYGSPTALLIDVASFAICGAMLIDLRPHVAEAEASVRARVRAAWEHIVAAPALRGLLLVEGCALVFFASDGSIEVPYAKATLHAGDRGYGLIVTMWGAGVVIGSVVFARAVRHPLGAILSAGALAIGLAYLGWAIAPTLALACVAGMVGGLGNGVQWAAFISAVQRLTPPDLQGRMMGAVESLGAIFPALGLALGGALVALSSPRGAFLVVGLGAALSTIAFMRLRLGALNRETPVAAANDEAPAWDSAPDSPDFPPSSASRAP
ncbi:MAG TPA: MFS transporter [Solirubrobacteraceae bacterium]|nr:MFS transporter [Solirubrobacteraceae bacterium]